MMKMSIEKYYLIKSSFRFYYNSILISDDSSNFINFIKFIKWFYIKGQLFSFNIKIYIQEIYEILIQMTYQNIKIFFFCFSLLDLKRNNFIWLHFLVSFRNFCIHVFTYPH